MTGVEPGRLETTLAGMAKVPVSDRLTGLADAAFAQWLKALPHYRRAVRMEHRLLWKRLFEAAAAAVALLLVATVLSRSAARPAWASVVKSMARVTSVHYYELSRHSGRPRLNGEGWFVDGQCNYLKYDGTLYVDDGRTVRVYDDGSLLLREEPSELGELVTKGFSLDIVLKMANLGGNALAQQRPVEVGEDFLVYRFDMSPPDCRDCRWFSSVEVVVGRNSLLPLQLKGLPGDGTEGDYDLLVFDYLGAPAPAEREYGKAECAVGEEVALRVQNSPGITRLLIRVYPSERLEGTLVADASAITTDGHRRPFLKGFPFEATMRLTGGNTDSDWPDGRFRHFRYDIRFQRLAKNRFSVKGSAWFDHLPE